MAIPHTIDQGIGTRASLGLVVLQTDETIEHEFAPLMAIDGVALHHTRIPMTPEVRPDTLARMEADLPRAISLFPTSLALDVIGYGCTSAASVIGSEGVAKAVRSVQPQARATDPIDSIIAACTALKAQRIAFLTPYVPDVSARMRAVLEAAGMRIVAFGSFEQEDDRVVARISPQSILDAIEGLGREAECDAVIVSCTNLRVAGIVAEAERRLGRPVVSSNLGLAWNMLRLAGIDAARDGAGVLFGHSADRCSHRLTETG